MSRVHWYTALVVGLCAAPVAAQNGSNFKVLSNGFDVIYAGLGAGGGQVPGVDGFGTFAHGEEVRGNTLTTLGGFGYKEAGWRESLCVLGSPIAGLRMSFPVLTIIEFDGVNPWGPGAVFTRPFCPTAGCFPLGGSTGFAPYGVPAGGSAAFLLAVLPSGAGLPSSTTLLLPNIGLLPSSNGGTAAVIAAVSSSIPIASTGFCWVVQFGWAPSALAGLDDINGWWRWHTNAEDGNQYWGLSNDELSAWQSQTVFTDQGSTALIGFFANLDYDLHLLAVDPVTNDALSPVGANGTGTYYATGSGVPGSGNSVNGGFDLGRHTAWSLDGVAGVPNPNTGVANQDPAGAPTGGLVPSLGWVTWNNGPLTTPTRERAVLYQLDLDQTLGIDPAQRTDILKLFGQLRLPVQIPFSQPGWPQPLTVLLYTTWVHEPADQTGVSGWPDPSGFAAGTFGVPPIVASSLHLPLSNGVSLLLGVPFGGQGGSIPIEDYTPTKAVGGTGSTSLAGSFGLLATRGL